MKNHGALPQVLITGGTAFAGGSPGTVNGMSSAELYTPGVLVPAPVATAASPEVGGEALSMYTSNLADGGVIPPQVIGVR